MDKELSYKDVLNLVKKLSAKERKILIQKLYKEQEKLYYKTRKKEPFSRGLGVWEGKVWMSEDFNSPLSDFKEYME